MIQKNGSSTAEVNHCRTGSLDIELLADLISIFESTWKKPYTGRAIRKIFEDWSGTLLPNDLYKQIDNM